MGLEVRERGVGSEVEVIVGVRALKWSTPFAYADRQT